MAGRRESGWLRMMRESGDDEVVVVGARSWAGSHIVTLSVEDILPLI